MILAQTVGVDAAEQAYANADYERARKLAVDAVDKGGLSHAEVARAYLTQALAHAARAEDDAARTAFVQLLTIDPEQPFDPNLGPRVQSLFMEARGVARSQPSKPGLDISAQLRSDGPGALRVGLRDPQHMVVRLRVSRRWGSTATFQSETLAAVSLVNVPVAPPPSGETRLEYYAEGLDGKDNAIFELGSPQKPRASVVDAPRSTSGAGGTGARAGDAHSGGSILSSPIFWIGAGVLLAGSATALYFGTRGGSTTTTPATSASLSPAFGCGTAACQ